MDWPGLIAVESCIRACTHALRGIHAELVNLPKRQKLSLVIFMTWRFFLFFFDLVAAFSIEKGIALSFSVVDLCYIMGKRARVNVWMAHYQALLTYGERKCAVLHITLAGVSCSICER
ncbi:hypothetical protein BX616_009141 [Lobosporangium transversale]|uniref:Uncharacterized protein n=1 Tax=Lobosporangium transversale TaxID=64571 RepID=A0A1Y2GM72_9FUNG|nr:hypothetical protein BCR41DRAFT_386591 [Lobosporangium transversale]KAF9914011.1 hypothetical protein BX616_009141 [Lobosporangium transversale]ORZ15458.1 hypothetical protein BCR41DRAFT_386591 [Lobosporangium transversale]|eukprot:XP_021881206.1 hypothetical protein BCR41DRAFT_386591 [Lobosporangium transversale]